MDIKDVCKLTTCYYMQAVVYKMSFTDWHNSETTTEVIKANYNAYMHIRGIQKDLSTEHMRILDLESITYESNLLLLLHDN